MIFVIADNQPVTAYALSRLLIDDKGHEVVCAATNKELISILNKDEEAVVLLDFPLFNFNSADDLLIVSSRFPSVRWILFSEELPAPFLYRFIVNEKMFGSVFKDESLTEIKNALTAVASGHKYISAKTEKIIEQYIRHRSCVSESEKLTRTEEEILVLMAKGLSSKEIADRRFSSIHTIMSHRKNIFRKLQVNTVFEAIRYAQRAGMVENADFSI